MNVVVYELFVLKVFYRLKVVFIMISLIIKLVWVWWLNCYDGFVNFYFCSKILIVIIKFRVFKILVLLIILNIDGVCRFGKIKKVCCVLMILLKIVVIRIVIWLIIDLIGLVIIIVIGMNVIIK